MISRSVYFSCRAEQLSACLAELGINPPDVAWDIKTATGYLAARRNGATVSTTQGAFAFICDVDLFDKDEAGLYAALARVSRHGILLAVPVERDPDPEVHWLWEAGERRLVRVWEDEGERLVIRDPLGHAGSAGAL